MVNVPKLRAQMALRGHTQRSLVTELNNRGIKISENSFSSKMTGSSVFDCEMADAICEILDVTDNAEKAQIFLA